MKLVLSLLAVAAVAPLGAQSLPEGKGKDLVESYCGSCHGLDSVTSQKASKEVWESIVNYMVSRGMVASNEEITTIIEYLAKAFPQPPGPEKSKPTGKDK
jgi:mono/diheme cytochrome c family protein